MQIDALKMFCDLAEGGSFTKAGEKNGVTQSAVSQQVASMEKYFGCSLVKRDPKRRLRLTREGEAVYEHGKRILNAYAAALRNVEAMKEAISGTVSVATIYSIGVYKLPRALRIFMKAHPSVRVELNYRAWNELLEEVKSNAVDIGLVAHPQRGEFEVVPIEEETLVLGVYPGHTFAKLTSVKAKDLHRQRFIMFPSRSPTGKGIERQLRHAGVKVQPVMEIQNVDTIKRAVEIGAGIAILPKNVMGAEVESGTLMQVEISDVEMKRPIGVIYKKGKRLSPPIRKFIEVLKGTKGGEK